MIYFKSVDLWTTRSPRSSHAHPRILRDNIYIIKTLKEFTYIDEFSKDQGANVRQKAKDITNLLQDDARLREQRKTRASMRERMVGGEGDGDYDREPSYDESAHRRSHSTPPASRSRRNQGDDEMKRAIEESKRSAEMDRQRQANLTAEYVHSLYIGWLVLTVMFSENGICKRPSSSLKKKKLHARERLRRRTVDPFSMNKTNSESPD